MKFKCNKPMNKLDALEKAKTWHKIFAFLPVRVGPDDCRWLEFVERRYTGPWIGPLSGELYLDNPVYRAIVKRG